MDPMAMLMMMQLLGRRGGVNGAAAAPAAPAVAATEPRKRDPVKADELDARKPVNVLPGRMYLAQVVVPFDLASEADIRTALEGQGFRLIAARRSRPANWPSNDRADWFVVADYTGESKSLTWAPVVKRAWLVSDEPQPA